MRKRLLASAIIFLSFCLLSPISAEDVIIQTEIQPTLSITFNYNTVNFGILPIGSNNNPAPNQTNGIYNVTVNTNQNYKVEASGTNFNSSSGYSFSVSNLKMDTNSIAPNLSVNNSTTLSSIPQIIDNNINYTIGTHYHGFWLSIPSSQYATIYTSTITITYSNVA